MFDIYSKSFMHLKGQNFGGGLPSFNYDLITTSARLETFNFPQSRINIVSFLKFKKLQVIGENSMFSLSLEKTQFFHSLGI